MRLRLWRICAGILVGTSGALLYAASWQRWACTDGMTAEACAQRQDHLYDFLPPAAPWAPAGNAAALGGLSLLVLALALPLLPWALTGRRPGIVSAIGLLVSELALVAVGAATLRSGISGVVVDPVLGGWAVAAWALGPPILFSRFAVSARGWARAASVLLALGMPLVASATVAIGEYDTRPWWEAVPGACTVLAALCLLVAAARRPERAEPVARPVAGGFATRPA